MVNMSLVIKSHATEVRLNNQDARRVGLVDGLIETNILRLSPVNSPCRVEWPRSQIQAK